MNEENNHTGDEGDDDDDVEEDNPSENINFRKPTDVK